MKKQHINPYKQFDGAWLPVWLLERPELSSDAKVMYALLAKFAGKKGYCWPTQNTLAQYAGMTKSRTLRAICELKDNDLIESKRRGLQRSNLYYFLDHVWLKFKYELPDFDPSEIQEVETGAIPEFETGNNRNGSLEMDNGNESKTDKPANHEFTYSDDFEAFWQLQLRKVGKGEAYRVWCKINDVPEQHIINAWRNQSERYRLRQERLGQEIPHPRTWLSHRRWDDDPDGVFDMSKSKQDRVIF